MRIAYVTPGTSIPNMVSCSCLVCTRFNEVIAGSSILRNILHLLSCASISSKPDNFEVGEKWKRV